MATQTYGKLTVDASFFEKPSAGAFAGSPLPVGLGTALKLSAGTGANDLIDLMAFVTLTFVASTPQSLDFSSLTGPLSEAVNLANVRALVFLNLATTAGYVLTLGDAGTNEWDALLSSGGTAIVPPSSAGNPTGGFLIVGAPHGLAVDGTHKALKMDPGGNAFSAIVFVLGSST